MWIDANLPPDVVARIEPICTTADQLVDRHEFDLAIQMFREALELLPAPPHQWVAATWILTAIGDTAYYAADLDSAEAAFREITLQCRGWEGSPIIALRRGQIAYDRGNMALASDCLASAFMLSGYDILTTVDEKYAEFILGLLDPPVPPVDHPLARFHRKPKIAIVPAPAVEQRPDSPVVPSAAPETGPKSAPTASPQEVVEVAQAPVPPAPVAQTPTPEPTKKKRPWWKFW